LLSNSSLILGIIEDVDIYKIKRSSDFRFCKSSESTIDELSNSIKKKGLLQPIIIRERHHNNCYFEIVAGNRRYEACKALGWRKIICHIVELSDKEAFEVALAENIQREAFNPIEEAYAFKKYVQEFGWGGVSDLALVIGKSISYVDKRLRLLELPLGIIEKISNSILSPTVAEELLPISQETKQTEVANIIYNEHLSVRKARKLIKDQYQNLAGNNEYDQTIIDVEENVQRSFDKSIITLKIAMNNMLEIIEGVQYNWIIYEILLQHKKTLHEQIDLLIKEKRKIA
jgi:ParB family transcriptional regulator, chromosome partitioning protein